MSALLDVLHSWSQALDQGKGVCAVFFDLQNAVPHKSLIDKLQSIGLHYQEYIRRKESFRIAAYKRTLKSARVKLRNTIHKTYHNRLAR